MCCVLESGLSECLCMCLFDQSGLSECLCMCFLVRSWVALHDMTIFCSNGVFLDGFVHGKFGEFPNFQNFPDFSGYWSVVWALSANALH